MDEYYESEFYKTSSHMMKLIYDKFEEYDFVKKFQELEQSQSEYYDYIVSKVENLPELEKWTLNEMCKMFSQNNCWYVMYEIGEVIHIALIHTWKQNEDNEEYTSKVGDVK